MQQQQQLLNCDHKYIYRMTEPRLTEFQTTKKQNSSRLRAQQTITTKYAHIFIFNLVAQLAAIPSGSHMARSGNHICLVLSAFLFDD